MARIAWSLRGLGISLLLATPALAEGARADELFKAGNRAFAAGDARSAYEAYREAWSLRKSFDIACNLGRTEAELLLSRDAAEHLEYCLRTYPASSREDLREAYARFGELFKEVRARVGALRIESKPQGAEVLVDGAAYGTTPLEADVFVDPGAHRVQASLIGFTAEERPVEVGAGSTLVVAFSLGREPSASVAPPPVAPAASPPDAPLRAEPRSASLRTTAVLSGAGLTLVGLGLGTGYWFDARASRNRVERLGVVLRDALGPGACADGSAERDCASLREAVEKEHRARELSGVFYTAGALTALGSLAAWVLLPDDSTEAVPRARLTPWLGSGSAGLTFDGRY